MILYHSYVYNDVIQNALRYNEKSCAILSVRGLHAVNTASQTSKYRQNSNTIRTKSDYLKVSRFILQLSLPNPLKPGFKSRMKM